MAEGQDKLRDLPSPVCGKRLRLRVWLAILAVLLLLLFGGMVYSLRWVEWLATYHPNRHAEENWRTPDGAENVWFTTADEVRLNGWYFKAATPHPKATIIHLHGNSGNITNIEWMGEQLTDRGFNVLVFDYRGYGRSEGQIQDEISIYRDADAAYDYLINRRGVRPDQIVLYGQSLGTTAAIDVAARRRCGAVIVESGLSSAVDLAGSRLPWLPQFLYVFRRSNMASADKIGQIHAPVLITHGDPDPVVPTAEGRELFARANEPKELRLFPGAGHNVFGSQGKRYLNLLGSFIEQSVPGSSQRAEVSHTDTAGDGRSRP
jgi:uncharacterized protein